MRVKVVATTGGQRGSAGSFHDCEGEVIDRVQYGRGRPAMHRVRLDTAPEDDHRQGLFPLTYDFLESEVLEV